MPQLNLPDIERPAMAQDQFDYDNDRLVKDQVWENIPMLAFAVRNLSERLSHLEGKILWLEKNLKRQSTAK